MIPKFRAWIKSEKCFADYIESIRYYSSEIDLCWGGICESDTFNLDSVELILSTGLKDKNGKEIFEEDVVYDGFEKTIVNYGKQTIEEEFGAIREYVGFNLTLACGYPEAVPMNYEIIGNIYENPELIK